MSQPKINKTINWKSKNKLLKKKLKNKKLIHLQLSCLQNNTKDTSSKRY